jgi:hypothetical protein
LEIRVHSHTPAQTTRSRRKSAVKWVRDSDAIDALREAPKKEIKIFSGKRRTFRPAKDPLATPFASSLVAQRQLRSACRYGEKIFSISTSSVACSYSEHVSDTDTLQTRKNMLDNCLIHWHLLRPRGNVN